MLLQDIMDMLSRMINMYQMPRISPKDSLTRAALRPAHQAAIGPRGVQGLFSRPLLGLIVPCQIRAAHKPAAIIWNAYT